jgi:hypothetical protein
MIGVASAIYMGEWDGRKYAERPEAPELSRTDKPPEPLTAAEQYNNLMADLGDIMTQSVGAVPAFDEAAKAAYASRIKANPTHSLPVMRQIKNDAQAFLEGLRSAWEAAGKPTPRPANIAPAGNGERKSA